MRTRFSPLAAVLTAFLAGCGPRAAGPTPATETPVPPETTPGAAPERPQQAKAEDAPLQWRFERDDDGRPVRVVDPAGRPTTFAYHQDGRKRLQRLEKKLADGSSVALDFDEFGQARSMTDATGETSYAHDGFGRLTRVGRAGLPDVRFEYDGLDRVTALHVGADCTIEYAYDFQGRLAAMKTPAGDVRYEYRPGDGEVARTLPNGIATVWRCRPDGRLASITHADKDRLILAQFQYTYRPDGRIAEIKETTRRGEKTIRYEYDTAKRLTAVDDSRKGKTAYAYDPYGNRTKVVGPDDKAVASKCDWAGRLVEHGGLPCEQDGAGALTRYAGLRGEASLSYTADGLLRSSAVVGSKVEYRYDGAGDLVGRAEAGAATRFVTDPRADSWRPLTALEGDKKTYYIWEGDRPLAALTDGQVRFFLLDHLGSVRATTGADGRIADSDWRDYDAFGVPSSPPDGLQPGFTGLFYDAPTGLYLARARAYEPTLGRFLQRDPQHRTPMGSANDLCACAYCGDDPVNYHDCSGADRQPALDWEDLSDLLNADFAARWYAAKADQARASGSDWTARGFDILGGVLPWIPK
ncbi:MAG TPA: RHS repeat-associated core domain-containing protein [Gemmataceae bacterium]|nr:RHS repeat-associated core domain-containing protein [Gemmataceae bacterium]